MDPSRSEVFRGLGGAYQSLGQQQMAFASYQQAINLRPTDLLAYLKLGLLYEQLVRYGSAESLVCGISVRRGLCVLGDFSCLVKFFLIFASMSSADGIVRNCCGDMDPHHLPTVAKEGCLRLNYSKLVTVRSSLLW